MGAAVYHRAGAGDERGVVVAYAVDADGCAYIVAWGTSEESTCRACEISPTPCYDTGDDPDDGDVPAPVKA